VLGFLAVVAFAWSVLRGMRLRQALSGSLSTPQPGLVPAAESAARRLLRISFGLIWIVDGILQAQISMPLGMIPQAVEPTAAASPSWVQHLVNAGDTIWTYHPITAASAAVWVQVGIGFWLLVAPRGNWSRLAGVAAAGWGLVVWVFGESFGGIFAPGLSWMFGAPGAVVFYSLAGVLVALPDQAWTSPRIGRRILQAMGLFFFGMAVLQAWPGRGFWQGRIAHSQSSGSLTSMISQMSQTAQPNWLSSLLSDFGSFDADHGWAVNLFVVVALAAIGAAFLVGRDRVLRVSLFGAVGLCLADWVLVQDLGFLGGVGTDPNSMIPMALVFVAVYLALTRPTVPAPAPAPVALPAWNRSGWREWVGANPTYAFRSITAASAIAITLVGVIPMVKASTEANADPILARAVEGPATPTDQVAGSFDLVDQNGDDVTLSSLRGKAVALTFLDPVCTSDCPTIAHEFAATGKLLGASDRDVELVAINANPRFLSPAFLRAFDQEQDLGSIPNWRYLSGSLTALEDVWRTYGVEVSYETGGGMIDHSEIAFVIDPSGHERWVLDADPGPATAATNSSFEVTLANTLKDALRST
jgi:cytochrome oxidase Cu insertion factor (SCO1/SenC/PrrC family)